MQKVFNKIEDQAQVKLHLELESLLLNHLEVNIVVLEPLPRNFSNRPMLSA